VFVGDGNWNFFRDIHAAFTQRYDVATFVEPAGSPIPVFRERMSRLRHRRAMDRLLSSTDVCFFEWASDLLVEATSRPAAARIVTRLHSYELLFWSQRIDWRHVDRIILVSQTMRRRFAELHPAQADKCVVVYNGVDLERFQPREDGDFAFRVGILANLHPVKRIYDLVLSIYALRQQGHPATLHIAGGKVADRYFDTYHAAIIGAIRRLGMEDAIVWHGQVEDPAPWLQTMDVIVSNSYWEGQQVALLEALASGCYCLSHFWEGAEEVVPADCVFVTEQDLHRQLLAFADASPETRRSRRAESRRIASDRFDARRQREDFCRVVESVSDVSRR
jgi:glycosyltransferase involved in cell wall biosynthesis